MKKSCFISLILMLVFTTVYSQDFSFKYQPGFRYQVHTTIAEDVYLNSEYSHTSRVLMMEWLNCVKKDKDIYSMVGDYSLSENTSSLNVSYQQKREYFDTVYKFSTAGEFSFDQSNFMPVKRNFPLFIDGIKRGQSWFTPCYEVHDFRGELFGIDHPYKVPSSVSWQYLGQEQKDGVFLAKFKGRLTIMYEPNPVLSLYRRYPVVVNGFSETDMLFNEKMGYIHSLVERFDITYELSDGQIIRYKGESRSKTEKMEPIDPYRFEELKNLIGDYGDVTKGPGWVRITLNNINFGPEDYRLTPQEREKLDIIAKEVSAHRGRFIKIIGHTAHAGTLAGRAALSLQRAEVVRDYLLAKDAVDPDMLTVDGKGSTQPLDTSGTSEGNKKNRRVEIYIMVGND